MLLLILIGCLATFIMLCLNLVNWLIEMPTFTLFWVFSPIVAAVGIECLAIILIVTIEILRTIKWKRL